MNQEFDVARLQAMDDAEWARLQDAFFRRVYFFVKRYVDDHQTAEDLTQEVFLGAVRGIGGYDPAYTLEQFLFGIAKNRVIDHFRKHRVTLLPTKAEDDGERSRLWLENMPAEQAARPSDDLVEMENAARRRRVLGQILRTFVAELWEAGEFKKLQVLEYLFVLGGRNKDAARRFGIADEKAVAGIKFRAIEKLRALARQSDPNHSLFLGLWAPGAR
ncbi:MAG TPA: sigma-70 family RNA polymerase sigma factor [Planctomycetota bacterium]|nr:sigma-70 family RNA polymerase sigma factor [Planctomycetota bacterium]